MRMRVVMALLAVSICAWGAEEKELFRNEKVRVVEETLRAGASEPVHRHPPGVIVWLAGGKIEVTPVGGAMRTITPQRGEVNVPSAQPHSGKNVGGNDVRMVAVSFLGPGKPGDPPWGAAGLAPNYKVLIENQYARVYEIRIPAGHKEPQHKHKDRVVVCLSGAELRHVFPDGRTETSSLKTGAVVWRRGSTHIGENLGKTDLWAIGIEPK